MGVSATLPVMARTRTPKPRSSSKSTSALTPDESSVTADDVSVGTGVDITLPDLANSHTSQIVEVTRDDGEVLFINKVHISKAERLALEADFLAAD